MISIVSADLWNAALSIIITDPVTKPGNNICRSHWLNTSVLQAPSNNIGAIWCEVVDWRFVAHRPVALASPSHITDVWWDCRVKINGVRHDFCYSTALKSNIHEGLRLSLECFKSDSLNRSTPLPRVALPLPYGWGDKLGEFNLQVRLELRKKVLRCASISSPATAKS